jgi:hypothetical protein
LLRDGESSDADHSPAVSPARDYHDHVSRARPAASAPVFFRLCAMTAISRDFGDSNKPRGAKSPRLNLSS